jgi:DNA polymerase elongation subunit (family B)
MRHENRRPELLKALDPSHLYTYATTDSRHVVVRGRTADGSGVLVKALYKPTYYLPTDHYTGTSAFDGRPLTPRPCKSLAESREFLKAHPDAYGTIQPEYQYLSDVYGTTEPPFDVRRLYIVNIDIEVDAEDAFARPDDPFNPVITITLRWRHADESGVVVYGTKPYDAPDDITYVECVDETALLQQFLDDWHADGDYPDIVTGWNVQFYDIPYLVNRIRRVLSEEHAIAMSPLSYLKSRRVTIHGRDEEVIDVTGVVILDYLELYRKLTYSQQESYRLDHIAHVELGERKVSYEEYQSLPRLYRENYDKFIEYNMYDVELVDQLDRKFRFIELVCALAYMGKANLVDPFRQVKYWDIILFNTLRAEGKQIPPRTVGEKSSQYVGAYVKDPLIGHHPWVASFDVSSMYPTIIREWNISPEQIVGGRVEGLRIDHLLDRSADLDQYTQEDDVAIAANGLRMRRDDEGFLPRMMRELYVKRTETRKVLKQRKQSLESTDASDTATLDKLQHDISALDSKQMALKIALNSAYGSIGSQYFRYYDTHMAEAVTKTGQLVIRWVANDVNALLNRRFKTTDMDYIIASDTDSIYVRLGTLVEQFRATRPDASLNTCVSLVDKFCETVIEPCIDGSFTSLAKYCNVRDACLTMKREVIADVGVWNAKKNYALNCRDIEGVRLQTPKMKIMGMSAVKSSTPSLVRPLLKDAIRILLTGTQQDLWTFVEQSWQQFRDAPFEDVAFPRSVNGLVQYADVEKGIPIAVRGALLYNRLIADHKQYDAIRDGAKVKFCYIREPNRFQSNVIAAPGGCPPEWNIDAMIDYHTQWSKSFLEPLRELVQHVGWTPQPEATLF